MHAESLIKNRYDLPEHAYVWCLEDVEGSWLKTWRQWPPEWHAIRVPSSHYLPMPLVSPQPSSHHIPFLLAFSCVNLTWLTVLQLPFWKLHRDLIRYSRLLITIKCTQTWTKLAQGMMKILHDLAEKMLSPCWDWGWIRLGVGIFYANQWFVSEFGHAFVSFV